MDASSSILMAAMALGLLVAGVVAMVLVLRRIEWKPGAWRLRCLTCGRSASLESVGGLRIGAASLYARRVVRCSQCDRLRWAALERGDNASRADSKDTPAHAAGPG